jgi:uncharacterized protein (DUF1778 family)
MPTEKPRISITLDPADLEVLDRFASLSGQPRASFLAAMISAAVPEFARAADVMQLAKEAPAGVVRSVIDGMSNATTDALGLLSGVVDQSHDVLSKAKGKAIAKAPREHRTAEGTRLRGGAARRSAAGRKPGLDPLPLTGGSK